LANPNDRIEDYIHQRVIADLKGSGKPKWRDVLDCGVRKLAIEPKWSVSRIHIWVGLALLVFWAAIWVNTFHLTFVEWPSVSWIQFDQLKTEPRATK